MNRPEKKGYKILVQIMNSKKKYLCFHMNSMKYLCFHALTELDTWITATSSISEYQ